MADDTDSFLSRWSRRKAGVRSGSAVPSGPAPAAAVQAAVPAAVPGTAIETERAGLEAAPPQAAADGTANPAAAAPPTLADVALLTRDADYTRFLGGNVSPEVKNAALKHLFTDPHFNVMDGLDIYIGDYNTPDPLPAGMLQQMVQSQLLGLFDDDAEAQPSSTAAPASADAPPPALATTADPTSLAADENPDLQLQPDDDAGRPGAEGGTGPHAGRPD